MRERINVLGLGYIGLPTAAILADAGFSVTGVDVNETIVNKVNAGKIHIKESGLEEIVKRNITAKKLLASNNPSPSEVFIICVPTPFVRDDGNVVPDLSFVYAAIDSICPVLKDDDLILIESTCPVGTTLQIQNYINSVKKIATSVRIAYCPERILPGNMIFELTNNSRVVGGVDEISTKRARNFYAKFVTGEIIMTNSNTAEACKLVENAYRDVNIAFANEISILADELEINPYELVECANYHPRVDILWPGPGVGGHCIAVDPWFLIHNNQDKTKLIQMARTTNDQKPFWVVDQIKRKAKEEMTKDILCLGLAYKPNIDDIRESPAVIIVNKLIEEGFNVKVIEPNLSNVAGYSMDALSKIDSFSGVICALVAHDEFKMPKNLKTLQQKVTLDFCGLFSGAC